MLPLLQISDELLPETLSERSSSLPMAAGMLLIGAFVLMSVARFFNPGIYGLLFGKSLKVQGIRAYLRETIPLTRTGSVLLIFNYLFCGAAIMLLKYVDLNNSSNPNYILLTAVPSALLVWNALSILLVGWVTGETDRVLDALVFKILGTEVTGVFFFIIALVWILNPQWSFILWQIAVWIFVLESVLRILKSYFALIANGIDWYYLILYLCTLEILPLFVAYHLLVA